MNHAKPPELLPMVCANDIQLAQRNSVWFKTNVATNTILAFGTFLTTGIFLHRLLKKKSHFSASMDVLLAFNVLSSNVHAIIYGYIQYWSLIRALLYYDQPCKIMFTEYECFPYYSLNIFSRLMMITLYCAQTINIVAIASFPSLPESKKRGFLLVAIAFASSGVLSGIITSDGPNDNIQGNCLQRQGRNLNELKDQLFTYLYISSGCFVTNIVALVMTYWRKNQPQNTVSKKYQSIANYNASIVLSVITALVMIDLGVYSYATAYIVDHVQEIDPINVGLYSMWLYTYTIAEFILPAALLLVPAIIKQQRKIKIAALTTSMTPVEEQAKYFKSLANDWDTEFDKSYPGLTPVV